MRRVDPDRLLKQVGNRIAELRAERGMTQEQLAEAVDVSSRYLQSIEAGANLTLRSLAMLANALKVPVSALLEPPAPRKRRPGRPAAKG